MNWKCYPLFVFAALFGALSSVAFAQTAAPAKGEATKVTRPELLPIQDVAGLPRVILVGDSISIGYTLPARKLLEGTANVHRVLINGSSSQLGAEQITEWLGSEKWDVIHFNFGAYDLAITTAGTIEVPTDRYESNLRTIIAKLRAHSPGARLIFATTTPIPEQLDRSQGNYSAKDLKAYANVANRVMKEAGVSINDLHAVVAPRLTELQIPGNIHYRPEGNELIAQKVAEAITTSLKEPAPAKPAAMGEKGLRVFTCGHSFHVWVVPMLSEMAMNAGIIDHVIAGKSSIGGSTVMKHWNVPEETNLARQALRAGKVDVLTLSPIWLPDEGIEKFATLAFEHNRNIRITVQEYWLPNDEYVPVYPLQTKKPVDHNAATMPALRKAHDQYFHDFDEHVRGINKKLGKNAVLIVPAGQAVLALREKIIDGQVPALKTQGELFRDNWGHPTVPVQVLAAYCHFAVIYERSPVGLPLPTVLRKNPAWNEELNLMLQELAWHEAIRHPMSGLKVKLPQ